MSQVSENSPTTAEVLVEVSNAVEALQNAQETVVDANKNLVEHMGDQNMHGASAVAIEAAKTATANAVEQAKSAAEQAESAALNAQSTADSVATTVEEAKSAIADAAVEAAQVAAAQVGDEISAQVDKAEAEANRAQAEADKADQRAGDAANSAKCAKNIRLELEAKIQELNENGELVVKNSGAIFLTQAEFDALEEGGELALGRRYVITDPEGLNNGDDLGAQGGEPSKKYGVSVDVSPEGEAYQTSGANGNGPGPSGGAVLGQTCYTYYHPEDLAEHMRGWYYRNGDRFLLSSPQGQALNSLPQRYKDAAKITIIGEGDDATINLPSAFYTDGRGLFERAGPATLVGRTNIDTLRQIVARWPSAYSAGLATSVSGAATAESVGTNRQSGSNGGLIFGFDSALLGLHYAGTETVPVHVQLTPVIYLGA
jgi:hypothetical protein